MIGLNTAILTREIITAENRAARESDPHAWAAHLIRQANDGGTRKFRRWRVNIAATVDEDFRFAADEQDNRAFDLAHIQRLIILVEDKNVVAHDGLEYSTVVQERQTFDISRNIRHRTSA